MADKDGRDEIWIQFSGLRDLKIYKNFTNFRKEFHQAEVEILGTFDADSHGHMSGFAATLNAIELIKLEPRSSEESPPKIVE